MLRKVKEKMKETGDMTKAVGAIIREQMAKAGDYVETAADRAAQANVSLQNKMEGVGAASSHLSKPATALWTYEDWHPDIMVARCYTC